MSDVSVLSHEYKTASDLSQTINRALIALKKARLALPGHETITADEFASYRGCLADILAALIGLLDRRQAGPDSAALARVPGALVTRLQRERRGDLPYYLDDLQRVTQRLRDDPSKLEDADFTVLDQLAAIADAETSDVFRRLMRK
ncbi:MAG TPA: hypothetical protein VNL96_06655 [Gemmatimonadaceae bacterium]|nr:hypothetical protein [Gemmatimonadaceae bacterium]